MKAAPSFEEEPEEERWERTELLLERIRAGDRKAESILLARYRPTLVHWAHGQLPAYARGLAETEDLVQVALLNAFLHLKRFEYRRKGSFHLFLRTVLRNEIRGVIRKVKRRPATEPLPDDLQAAGASPLEQAIGKDLYRLYEECLNQLSTEQAEAMALLDLGFNNAEIARLLDLESANAARMRVSRGAVHLAKLMGRALDRP